jgi:dTDP-glucose 4,6-dehydratase
METVLVTGGCGFIGSNFIRCLIERESATRIINLDCLSYAGNLANLEDVQRHPRYCFVRGDVADRDLVRDVVRSGVHAILNFAAESHVDRSIHDAAPFIRTNVLGTQTLLDAAREFKVKRFVQISTDEVYGSLGSLGTFREESPLAPNSPYSASKAAADLLVRGYVKTFGIDAVISRCSNNYGPYQFPEKLIPLFVSNLLRNEPAPLYGDGLHVRDWIHVRDHCDGVHSVWRKGRAGEVYNIGGCCEKTNLELTHALLRALGKPASLIRFVPDRPGHDRRYSLDTTKVERELGWSPRMPFDEGIRETVRWYREHAGWIEAIRSGDYLDYYRKQYPSLTDEKHKLLKFPGTAPLAAEAAV